jgi:hypothetical protein
LPALPARPEVHLDWISALLASAGMVALVYGLGEAASLGWRSGQIIGSLAAAAVSLTGFAGYPLCETPPGGLPSMRTMP